MQRFFIAGGLSVAVTALLFYVMQELVKPADEINLEESDDFQFVDIVQDIQETPPQAKETKIEQPPEVEAPPPELEAPVIEFDGPTGLDLSISTTSVSTGVNLGGIDLGPSQDGDYLPLVRVEPDYPRRAAERGIEGYITVSLTVNADGTVDPESVIVVDEDPKGYFRRSAVKAAARFKYKPKVVNGEPIPVSGVTYKFTFNLADDGRRR